MRLHDAIRYFISCTICHIFQSLPQVIYDDVKPRYIALRNEKSNSLWLISGEIGDVWRHWYVICHYDDMQTLYPAIIHTAKAPYELMSRSSDLPSEAGHAGVLIPQADAICHRAARLLSASSVDKIRKANLLPCILMFSSMMAIAYL